MKIVIIDYGAGNIKSIQFAFKRLGYEAILSSNSEEIKSADREIFPGVGEANSAMEKLKNSGLDLLHRYECIHVCAFCFRRYE